MDISGRICLLTVKEWVRQIFGNGSEFSGLCFLMDGDVMHWDDIPQGREIGLEIPCGEF